jgi:alpha-beta hydrolase superfamily lysophospholipase
MKILYLHGWHSVPGGVKPAFLKAHGHDLIEPALPDEDFDAAVGLAQAELDRHGPSLVVGSSRGGAVALNLAAGAVPLVLLCPAWKRWGRAAAAKPGTLVLHALADAVVPYSDTLELLADSGLPVESSLITVGSEHRLADAESLQALLAAVERRRP